MRYSDWLGYSFQANSSLAIKSVTSEVLSSKDYKVNKTAFMVPCISQTFI